MYRHLLPRDYLPLKQQLTAQVISVCEKPVAQLVDIEYAINQMYNMDHVVIHETYLLVYSVGKPWYSKCTVLEELMVLKILDGGGKFSDVTDALHLLAKEYGADVIHVGASLSNNPRALSRMYRRAGFIEEDTASLTKRM